MVRFKHRYLLVHLLFPASLENPLAPVDQQDAFSPPNVSESSIISLLRESLSVNFGDVGAGEVGGSFSVKYLSPHTRILILRVSREHYRTLWSALTLLRRVGGQVVIARVLHVSGTIRKIQHAAIKHDREELLANAKKARRKAKKGAAGGSESGDNVEGRLAESEKEIMAMEA